MSTESILFVNKQISKDVLIIVFSGRQQGLANLNIFEFRNFLESNFPNIDKCYLKDEKLSWYTKGITGISTDISSTLDFFKSLHYKSIVMIGASMGGYGALLYGSILGVDKIIAFRPQTHLDIINKEYSTSSDNIDINNVLNNKTKYYIYGDSSITDNNDIHSIEYCNRIHKQDNIIINRINDFDIKLYKDEGNLLRDLKFII